MGDLDFDFLNFKGDGDDNEDNDDNDDPIVTPSETDMGRGRGFSDLMSDPLFADGGDGIGDLDFNLDELGAAPAPVSRPHRSNSLLSSSFTDPGVAAFGGGRNNPPQTSHSERKMSFSQSAAIASAQRRRSGSVGTDTNNDRKESISGAAKTLTGSSLQVSASY